MVGGGNSAGQASLFLSRFTDSVTIIIRRDDLAETMSQYLIDNLKANERVAVQPHTRITHVEGDGHLQRITVEDLKSDTTSTVDAGALFIFVGQTARTDWLSGNVALDEQGFILTGPDVGSVKGWTAHRDRLPLETSVPGIFAAGDVRHGAIRRVAGAVGEGATAIRFVHQHLAAL